MRPISFLLVNLLAVISFAQGQSPFAPPRATLQYAPDRTCDLLDVSLDLDVDYANRLITGTSVNTLSPLRNGLTEVTLHAGTGLTLRSVTVDGKSASYRRDGRNVAISTGPLQKGKPIKIAIGFSAKNSRGRTFGAGGGGFHWIEPTASNPKRAGFWTQGETIYNSEWCPTWDYPNDLATSETRCTVQSDWSVIGNGLLVSTTSSSDKTRKTYTWKMSQPHATYLISLCGGPFDIKRDTWEGVQLWYVVPAGQRYLIDDSFGHTKDMLSFYSKILGVKYPWPKYAQCAMYDFGGGMENVSATTLGEGSLTESRDGYYNMDGLNAHELGHQWFGDLVTCMHWGDSWLNESFATYMQIMYSGHSRGDDAYANEIDGAMRGYISESRRYKRPLSTKLYPNPDAMFDQHTYPKGAAVLHTLRRQIGDEPFFAGLNYYLTKWRHTPVESAQLRRAFVEATGINVEPFWAQWIEKPGHPVIDYSWTWQPSENGTGGKAQLTVKQLQDTSDGTPIYDINAKVGAYLGGSKFTILPVHLSKAEETLELSMSSKPSALVLDPDHDFLREIPTLHWSKDELPFIVRFSKNAPDRAEALRRMLAEPDDQAIALAVEVFSKDDGVEAAFRQVSQLANLARPELRGFWLSQLEHKDSDRQVAAVRALAQLPQDSATTQRLRSLVNERSPIAVVVACIGALADWDAKGNEAVFKAATAIRDRRGRIRRAAESALGRD
jgi:aminopeptidase N